MNTFIPYADYSQSASALDNNRLSKQRQEALYILRALVLGAGLPALHNHPTVTMWRGCERDLIRYIFACCNEWTQRGYTDEVGRLAGKLRPQTQEGPRPAWVGQEVFHASQRAHLLFLYPEWFSDKGFDEEPSGTVLWPITKDKGAWVFTDNINAAPRVIGRLGFPGDYMTLTLGAKQHRCVFCKYLTDDEDFEGGSECYVCSSEEVFKLRQERGELYENRSWVEEWQTLIEQKDVEIGELIRAKRCGLVP